MLLRSCLIVSSLMVLGGGVYTQAASSPSHSSDSLHLNRFVLATNVENREPQNPKENFTTSDQQVFAFAEVSTPTSETITFVWSRDGKVHFEWSTQITASPRFRIFSSVKVRPGHWNVKIQDQSGKVLKEKSFEIQDSSGHHEETKSVSEPTHEKSVPQADSTSSPKGVKEALRSLQPTSEEANNTPPQPKEEVRTATVPAAQSDETVTKESSEVGK
jgi:hypothetical protein